MGRLMLGRYRFPVMGRKILFVTTDQQRYDALGCNGGQVARTPVVDALADSGLNYRRAHNQNVVCMPARSTMVTGQYVRTHGVWMNGVPLPESAPSIAQHLKEHAGYRTALLGKPHFEPAFDPKGEWPEGRMGHWPSKVAWFRQRSERPRGSVRDRAPPHPGGAIS
jgi:arylsulfatase A-like enzyme